MKLKIKNVNEGKQVELCFEGKEYVALPLVKTNDLVLDNYYLEEIKSYGEVEIENEIYSICVNTIKVVDNFDYVVEYQVDYGDSDVKFITIDFGKIYEEELEEIDLGE